ncbi:MAG TPA: GntR family transcriptional regulator [Gaiella sp.]
MAEPVPRYLTIEQSLRARVGALEPHDRMPSDAQLCEEFHVSRMTARGAVQRLVQEGLVYRVPGRGTFVAPARASRTASRILSFSDEMRRSGRAPRSRVVERLVRPATPEEGRRLDTVDVLVLRRVRAADGEPVALETAVFSVERVPPLLEADLEAESLFDTLADAGLVPTAGHAVITAEGANAEDARLLGVRRGSPLLVERRLITDQDDAPLELTESRYVPERYDIDVDFEVELSR